LLKTLVTFLMATPSPVWMLVAALDGTCQHMYMYPLTCLTFTLDIQVWGYLPHDTIGSLTELFCHIVLLAHDEVLVENLEDLATL
jgi:hypothetical protein